MALKTRLAPDSAPKAVAQRLRMATAIPGLGRDNRPARAIASALGTTALGRLSAAERDWARRIERRRRDVADLAGVRTPEEVGVYDIRLAVQWMSVPPTLGRLLMRLVHELAPSSSLELGTGFGISGAYLAAGLELAGRGRLVSIDVDSRPAAVASAGFSALGLSRAEVRCGDAEVAEAVLAELEPLGFAFVDSDHRGAAISEAFATMRPHLADGAVVVFDDIASKWEGTRAAWEAIAADERVASTRHLGRLGIVAMRAA
jgi:predicted O-methyltransferase YrrM